MNFQSTVAPIKGKLKAEPRMRRIADGTGIIGALGLQADDTDALSKDLLSDSSEPAEPVPFADSITPGWWTSLDEGRLQPFFRKQAAAQQVCSPTIADTHVILSI